MIFVETCTGIYVTYSLKIWNIKTFVFDSFLCSFKFQFYEVILGGLILLTCTAFQVLLSYIVTCNQFVVSKLIVLIWYVRMECITVLPLISAGPQIKGAL